MFRFITFITTIVFLSGCSSVLNVDKRALRADRTGGFNIVKYSGDAPTQIDNNGYDDFYENGVNSPQRGFRVTNSQKKTGLKKGSVIAKKIIVKKSKRKMYVFGSDGVVREYLVSLGKSPVGKKIKVGDGKTPEGNYDIEYHNPSSKFFYSLKISYPNKDDLKRAGSKGVSPGGDIFIHGLPNEDPRYINFVKRDWTNGCIAVSNEAIKEIAALVTKGTPITIEP